MKILLQMGQALMEEPKKKGPRTESIRILKLTAKAINEIAEATGKSAWQIVEKLVGAELPGWHKAIQSDLKKVREQKAKIEAIQKSAAQAGGA